MTINVSACWARSSVRGVWRSSIGIFFHVESVFEFEKTRILHPEAKYDFWAKNIRGVFGRFLRHAWDMFGILVVFGTWLGAGRFGEHVWDMFEICLGYCLTFLRHFWNILGHIWDNFWTFGDIFRIVGNMFRSIWGFFWKQPKLRKIHKKVKRSKRKSRHILLKIHLKTESYLRSSFL